MTGSQRAALLYSPAQSCRLVGVEPFAYLRDVLLRVATHPLYGNHPRLLKQNLISIDVLLLSKTFTLGGRHILMKSTVCAWYGLCSGLPDCRSRPWLFGRPGPAWMAVPLPEPVATPSGLSLP